MVVRRRKKKGKKRKKGRERKEKRKKNGGRLPLPSSKRGVDAANSRKGSNGIPSGFLDTPEFHPAKLAAVHFRRGTF